MSHAGDGNFHLMLILDPGNPAEMDRARRVVADMIALAHSMGGTCTGVSLCLLAMAVPWARSHRVYGSPVVTCSCVVQERFVAFKG